jgi:hypothetical protein
MTSNRNYLLQQLQTFLQGKKTHKIKIKKSWDLVNINELTYYGKKKQMDYLAY